MKVAIYEDNVGLREVLVSVIKSTLDLEMAGEFGNCMDVIENTRAFQPDVILMDIDMPGKSGIAGTAEVKAAFPKVEVIINTVFDDDNRIFEALKAGATGYLLKKSSLGHLVGSIREVKDGGAPMSPAIARKVLELSVAEKPAERPSFNLSDRELDVLKCLSRGLSYKMAADEMCLSIDTIRSYVKRIYEKLHVHSVTEAVHKVFIESKGHPGPEGKF
ncbi:MAG: response regulator transcription factor [Saprospiraceae bacterium]|nr:response regulator transcription factor [Saprospiraceae bacterium]